MQDSPTQLADAFRTARAQAEKLVSDKAGLVGYGVVELRGPDGRLKEAIPFSKVMKSVV